MEKRDSGVDTNQNATKDVVEVMDKGNQTDESPGAVITDSGEHGQGDQDFAQVRWKLAFS